MVVSSLAVANTLPSGLKATSLIWSACPRKTPASCPVATSQRCAVLSCPVEARRAVAAESHAHDRCGVAAQSVNLLAAGRVPESDDKVPTSGSRIFAIRTEGDAADDVAVACEGADHAPTVHGPQLHRAVIARRGENLAIGAEGDALDSFRMSPENMYLPAIGHMPHIDVVVPTSGSNQRFIRAQCDADEIGRVRVEASQLFAAEPAQIMPFPASQVWIAWSGRSASVAVEQVHNPLDLGIVPGLMGQVNVCRIECAAAALMLPVYVVPFLLGNLALLLGIGIRLRHFLERIGQVSVGSHQLQVVVAQPGAVEGDDNQQCGGSSGAQADQGRRGRPALDPFDKTFGGAAAACQDRFPREPAIQVVGELFGGAVAARVAFSRHFRQMVSRSGSTFLFRERGMRGSCSITWARSPARCCHGTGDGRSTARTERCRGCRRRPR